MICTTKKCIFPEKLNLKEVFPIPLSFQELFDFLYSRPELANCICALGDHNGRGTVDCSELGRISWANPTYQFIHIRFDGCVCNDSRVKKCDCVIFRTRTGEPPVLFVIETKGSNPSFSEVKAQISYSIEKMLDVLPEPKTQFIVLPILCAGKRTAFMKEACLSNKITIFGKGVPISIHLYDEDINRF